MEIRIALSPVVLSCLNMRRMQLDRRAAVHVTVAGTTIAAHRSATATKTRRRQCFYASTILFKPLIMQRKVQPE
jgi:hypothetical protein